MARVALMLAAIAFIGVIVDCRHIHLAESKESTSDVPDMELKTDIEGLSVVSLFLKFLSMRKKV